jgi:recombinational DNA repair protein RecR
MTGKYTFGIPLKEIRPMTKEERQRAKERAKQSKCVSCGNVSTGDFCEFCLKEE